MNVNYLNAKPRSFAFEQNWEEELFEYVEKFGHDMEAVRGLDKNSSRAGVVAIPRPSLPATCEDGVCAIAEGTVIFKGTKVACDDVVLDDRISWFGSREVASNYGNVSAYRAVKDLRLFNLFDVNNIQALIAHWESDTEIVKAIMFATGIGAAKSTCPEGLTDIAITLKDIRKDKYIFSNGVLVATETGEPVKCFTTLDLGTHTVGFEEGNFMRNSSLDEDLVLSAAIRAFRPDLDGYYGYPTLTFTNLGGLAFHEEVALFGLRGRVEKDCEYQGGGASGYASEIEYTNMSRESAAMPDLKPASGGASSRSWATNVCLTALIIACAVANSA